MQRILALKIFFLIHNLPLCLVSTVLTVKRASRNTARLSKARRFSLKGKSASQSLPPMPPDEADLTDDRQTRRPVPTGTECLSQACLLLAFVKETAMQKHAFPLWCLISPKLGHK